MRQLTVLYDGRCEICCRAKAWLQKQPAYVAMEFLQLEGATARARYPTLSLESLQRNFTVVADNGGVYRGHRAWIMCVWALHEYRDWALTLSHPLRMPLAQWFFKKISTNRYWMSSLLKHCRLP